LRLCNILDPGTRELLDRGLVVFLPGPGSYTAEDVVELHLHGGPAVVASVLAALGSIGLRPAGPGEFTLRAFLNGRIDLSEAEAVAALVEARSSQAARSALRQLRGGLAAALKPLRVAGIELLAELEASLDFPEEDLGVFRPEDQARRLSELERDIGALLGQAPLGRRLREGARVVIAGRPNVGKSSLMNALLGRERAIVHSAPGTTRDYLEDELVLGGVNITLVDTAGQRPSLLPEEAKGVELAKEQMSGADLVLYVFNLAEGITPEDDLLIKSLGDSSWVAVLNQRDRAGAEAEEMARRRLGDAAVVTSATTGGGVDVLGLEILQRLGLGKDAGAEIPVITEARHVNALRQALERIREARLVLEAGLPHEVVALELRRGLEALGNLLGEGVGEALLDAIFSRFCIGK
jgi:tRNA modification GTPase